MYPAHWLLQEGVYGFGALDGLSINYSKHTGHAMSSLDLPRICSSDYSCVSLRLLWTFFGVIGLCLIVGNSFRKTNKQTNNISLEKKAMPCKILLKLNTDCDPNIYSLRKDKRKTEIKIFLKDAFSDA